MNHQNKIALVTGGSRGLGRSTAISLARRGVYSVITYHTNRAEADKVVGEITGQGAKAIALRLDVGDTSSFDAFAQQLRAALPEFGAERFDYLVNNAGTALHKSFDQTTEAELDELYRVHFKGVFFLTQKLLPLLNDGGRIVNLSSGLARFSIPGYSAYASMKGAVEVLTRYLAKELGLRRIGVNVVAPGIIETDFTREALSRAGAREFMSANIALGRVGLPDDIGLMIAALLSDENRWVNAQRIEVSGGMNI